MKTYPVTAELTLVYFNKLLAFSIKLINPIEKYPDIIESYTRILKKFQLQSYRSMLHRQVPPQYCYSDAKLSNEFLLVHTHEDL